MATTENPQDETTIIEELADEVSEFFLRMNKNLAEHPSGILVSMNIASNFLSLLYNNELIEDEGAEE